jgi:glutamate 5-kinase
MNKKIITIKIGTSVSFTDRGVIDEYRIGHLASQIAQLHQTVGVVLVVSGAVACGRRAIYVNDDLTRQAAAGIGQAILTSSLTRIFEIHHLVTAQVLVKNNNLGMEISKLIHLYTDRGIVPIFNENDVVSTTSDFVDGNDFLAVAVARCIGSRQLVILSTMKGSNFGVGGGEAKLRAIKEAQEAEIKTQILDGKVKNILLKTI